MKKTLLAALLAVASAETDVTCTANGEGWTTTQLGEDPVDTADKCKEAGVAHAVTEATSYCLTWTKVSALTEDATYTCTMLEKAGGVDIRVKNPSVEDVDGLEAFGDLLESVTDSLGVEVEVWGWDGTTELVALKATQIAASAAAVLATAFAMTQ